MYCAGEIPLFLWWLWYGNILYCPEIDSLNTDSCFGAGEVVQESGYVQVT